MERSEEGWAMMMMMMILVMTVILEQCHFQAAWSSHRAIASGVDDEEFFSAEEDGDHEGHVSSSSAWKVPVHGWMMAWFLCFLLGFRMPRLGFSPPASRHIKIMNISE